jgi:hypothetical protein
VVSIHEYPFRGWFEAWLEPTGDVYLIGPQIESAGADTILVTTRVGYRVICEAA